MDAEAGFLAAIAANPDDDQERLVFADWLEEHGESTRAEFIRVSCQFDPFRERFDDLLIDAHRRRLHELQRLHEEIEEAWRESLHPPLGWNVTVEWRRGFVDTLELPAPWFVEYGDLFRERYPLLRKLVLFRLNGWGQPLAACKALEGIREIELPCWYDTADAEALANSSHVDAVERLVLWSGGSEEQAALLARSQAWPKLREVHLVAREGPQTQWVDLVNQAAGRTLATVYDFSQELFPFAPDFAKGYGFVIGKLPEGTQLFALGDESEPTIDGWLFTPEGRRREPFRFQFPSELIFPPTPEPTDDWNTRWSRKEQLRKARVDHFSQHTGFRPAFIRVEGFTLETHGLAGPGRYRSEVEDAWGLPDDPTLRPEEDESPQGYGGTVYFAVRSGEYTFDFGNEWWCDRTGHITST